MKISDSRFFSQYTQWHIQCYFKIVLYLGILDLVYWCFSWLSLGNLFGTHRSYHLLTVPSVFQLYLSGKKMLINIRNNDLKKNIISYFTSIILIQTMNHEVKLKFTKLHKETTDPDINFRLRLFLFLIIGSHFGSHYLKHCALPYKLLID